MSQDNTESQDPMGLGKIVEQLKPAITPLTQTELPSVSVPEIDAVQKFPILGQQELLGEFVNPDQPKYELGDRQPNIRLSGAYKDRALTEGLHNVGQFGYVIPNKETQLKGFYVDRAGEFVVQFRQFKLITDKGQNAPSVQI